MAKRHNASNEALVVAANAGRIGVIAERVWSRIDASGDCWDWTGHVGTTGYGTYSCKIEHRVVNVLAHRLVYALLIGPDAGRLTLDHCCRNRRCVNPDHLEPVTLAENLRRSPAVPSTRHAAKTHCPAGHPYDAQNTHVTRTGVRQCRACGRANNRRYYARKKEVRL